MLAQTLTLLASVVLALTTLMTIWLSLDVNLEVFTYLCFGVNSAS